MRVACRALLVLTALGLRGAASDNDALLDQVRAGHRAARQSVHTLSATYVVRETLPSNNVMASGKYWRSGDTVRIQDGNVGTSTEDCLLQKGQCRRVGQVWQEDGKRQYFAVRQTEAQFFHWGDIGREMLIDLSDPDGRRCTYDRMLERLVATAKLKRERLRGHECVRIDATDVTKGGHVKLITIWHDPDHNYLIRKLEVANQSSPDKDTAEIEDFAEPATGVFIPSKCRVDSYRGGKLSRSREAVLSDIAVNQPIPASVFTLPEIPPGTVLQDTVNGVMGPVGSDWKPQGAMKAMEQITLPPRSESAGVGGMQQTAREPWSTGQVVLIASVSVLAVCVVLLLIRGVRARRSAG